MKKYYFSIEDNKLINQDGVFSANIKDRPQSTLGEKDFINVQHVNNSTSPLVNYSLFVAGTTARFLVDVDYLNPGVLIPLGNTGWSLSSGTEYKKILSTKPDTVEFDGVNAVEGTVGALSAGEWGYIEISSEIVVRLSDDTDPSTKDEDYIQVLYINENSTPLFIEASSDVFNLPNSWLDDDGVTFRDPDITAGETSFYLNSNTVNFYSRIGGSIKKEGFAEIQFFEPSTGLFFMKAKFAYDCTNRLLSSGDDPLELVGVDVYTKAESDAKYLAKIVSPVVDNLVVQTPTGLADAGKPATNVPTNDEAAAIQGANSPSASNVFATIDDLAAHSVDVSIPANAATAFELGRLDAGRGFEVTAMFTDEVSGNNEGATSNMLIFLSQGVAAITNKSGFSEIPNLNIVSGFTTTITGTPPNEVVNLVITTTAGNALKMNLKATTI